MTRRSASPRFAVPAAPARDETAIAVEQAKTDKEFDDYLCDLLMKRALRYRLREPFEQNKVKKVILPQIRAEVDPALIDCICSNNPTENHNLPIPKNPIYVREDQVTFKVRSIIRMVYPKAHNEFIRQKEIGCMMTVQNKVGRIHISI